MQTILSHLNDGLSNGKLLPAAEATAEADASLTLYILPDITFPSAPLRV